MVVKNAISVTAVAIGANGGLIQAPLDHPDESSRCCAVDRDPFMDLRVAPRPLRLIFEEYVLVVFGALVILDLVVKP